MYDAITNVIGLSFVVLCGLLLLVSALQDRGLPRPPLKRHHVAPFPRSKLIPNIKSKF